MSSLNDVLTFSRAQAQTDSNGLTDTLGIIYANEALVDFRRRLISQGIDASQTQEAYTDGTANQGTYLYPTDMFFLKAIEVNFQDSNPQNYITANQLDVSNIPAGQSFSWLRANQTAQFPLFDDRGDQFEIFPTPTSGMNLTQMFRIFYFLQPSEFSSTSDTITYPETLDYRLLGWRIASDYFYALTKIAEGDAFNFKYEERVKQLISTLGRGTQQPLQAVPIQNSGWNF